jgi:SWI/SNF-related matrix-associated actin-dependent regulator of chromatin subfamily D
MVPDPQSQFQQSRAAQEHHKNQRDLALRSYKEDKIRAGTPSDRNLPDGIEDIVIGNGVQEYKRLREIERKLDAVMMRKRLELQDQRQRAMPRTRKLRIWISNTAENQPWQGKDLDENAFDFNSGVDATYKVQIVGKLIDETETEENKEHKEPEQPVETEEGKEEAERKIPTPSKPQFSSFFKSIVIELDRNKTLQPDISNVIEWKKTASSNQRGAVSSADFDILQFERKSDENINCTIHLHRDEQPARFTLSKELQEVVGEEEATKETIVNNIWMYIRAQGLQRDEEKRLIALDEPLRAVSFRTTLLT